MKSYKFFFIFLLIIIFTSIVYVFLRLGYFPALVVNWKIVTFRDYTNEYNALSYFSKFLKSKGFISNELGDIDKLSPKDIKLLSIDSAINNAIVFDEGEKLFGDRFDIMAKQEASFYDIATEPSLYKTLFKTQILSSSIDIDIRTGDNDLIEFIDSMGSIRGAPDLDVDKAGGTLLRSAMARNILMEALKLEAPDFNHWLENKRKAANIKILIPGIKVTADNKAMLSD